ncbi:hypothetical protein AAG570_008894 [Ranatra chinensis]|uniref:TAFII55 protein conserved region domain-containing protein n=1 Tax=Ranatra chinensis TaxID=642074 RepID=A0ABD0Z541_9HEMI
MNKRESEPAVELESQFILRLPPEPAKVLRELLRSGVTSLKDRFSIRLENDVRYGEVRLDNWFLHAKVFDLPTIIESLKTIDNKSFYKTADICQIMICKEEDDQTTTDEDTSAKHKKKDPNKVDKKFLWPHGITPPLKNVRKRRFRKTLKKKYVEAPEIEKEVKRLLRGDNDAVSVKWEVISEEDDKKSIGLVRVKEEPQTEDMSTTQQSADVAERDIFGEAVSDSDEEEAHINILEENSRISADDSRISDSTSLHGTHMSEQHSDASLVTQFSKEMFSSSTRIKTEPEYINTNLNAFNLGAIRSRMEQLQQELSDLRIRRHQQEMEVANIENYALRQRFQDILDNLLQQQLEKEQEYQELSELLQMN